MGLALHQAGALEAIDHRRQVGRIHAEHPTSCAYDVDLPTILRNTLIVPTL
jgi:hypothetical protein